MASSAQSDMFYNSPVSGTEEVRALFVFGRGFRRVVEESFMNNFHHFCGDGDGVGSECKR